MKGILVVNAFLDSYKFNEIHAWLVTAAKKQGIELQIKTNADLLIDIPGERKDDVDFILFWDKDVKLAQYLEQLGYPVFNSSKAIRICDDKAQTHLTLMSAKLPMPRTIIAPMTFDNIGYTNYDFLSDTGDRLGFPLVVKECFGSFGQQVYLALNYEELLQQLQQCGTRPVIFQEFIQASKGRDVRLQVVGDRVVASMYRYSENGDFRANASIGGSILPYEPAQEQCELALQCCKVIGLDFAGVDLLFGDKDETLVCEVNSNAHFKNIFDCTGVNAADEIITYIKNKVY
jgi:RimK family alpha-L-glutamate ligase